MDLASELPCNYVDIPVKAEKTTSQLPNSRAVSQDIHEDARGKMPFKDEE